MSGTKFLRLDGSPELETDESLASEETLNTIKKLLVDDGVMLNTGTNRIGTTSGVLKMVYAEKVLEAEGAYAAGDVMSETDTASTGTVWTFEEAARVNGGGGYITGVHIIDQTTALTALLVLHLYRVSNPTCELDDNAPNTSCVWADRANYIGAIELPALSEYGTGASETIATPSTVGNLPLPFTCAANDDNLYGVLITNSAFDQVDDKSVRIELYIEQY